MRTQVRKCRDASSPSVSNPSSPNPKLCKTLLAGMSGKAHFVSLCLRLSLCICSAISTLAAFTTQLGDLGRAHTNHALHQRQPQHISGFHSPPSSCYVHIPFCRRRCYYCDFPIKVVGDGAGYVGELADEYIAALLREMDCTKAITQSSFAHTALRTLYIGGGTPSLLSVEQLKAVIDGVIRTFGSTGDIEITLEMDPGTFDRTKLASLLGLGSMSCCVLAVL
jgi:coproporphyrinogen III oxidase-like Fe-S oxidoreductase